MHPLQAIYQILKRMHRAARFPDDDAEALQIGAVPTWVRLCTSRCRWNKFLSWILGPLTVKKVFFVVRLWKYRSLPGSWSKLCSTGKWDDGSKTGQDLWWISVFSTERSDSSVIKGLFPFSCFLTLSHSQIVLLFFFLGGGALTASFIRKMFFLHLNKAMPLALDFFDFLPRSLWFGNSASRGRRGYGPSGKIAWSDIFSGSINTDIPLIESYYNVYVYQSTCFLNRRQILGCSICLWISMGMLTHNWVAR